ncbi:MAG: hypothetical protein C0404_06655 [Verrucomicrobia bacterium]|nr:hypothetical protein [Verrucomicrobiota bacterium]
MRDETDTDAPLSGKDKFAVLALRYLDGVATPAEEQILKTMLAGDTACRDEFVLLAKDRAYMQQIMQPAAQEIGSKSRSLWRSPVRWLALAACLAIVAGGAYLATTRAVSPSRGAGAIGEITAIKESPVAVIVRAGTRIQAVAGTGIQPGDLLMLQATGSVEVAVEGGKTRVNLSNMAKLGFDNSGRFSLSDGRLEISVRSREKGQTPFVVATPLASVTVVGTRFVLHAGPDNARVRVQEGIVEFRRSSDNTSVDVGAGDYAMVRSGVAEIRKGRYEEGLALDGKVVYSDDFETGGQQWTPSCWDKRDQLIEEGGNYTNLLRIVKLERDGVETKCLEVNGDPEKKIDYVFVCYLKWPMPENFVTEMDSFVMEHSSLAWQSYSYDTSTNKTVFLSAEARARNGVMLSRIGQWEHVRFSYQRMADRGEGWTHRIDSFMGGKRFYGRLFRETRKPWTGFKVYSGRVRFDNVVVRELLPLD